MNVIEKEAIVFNLVVSSTILEDQVKLSVYEFL